MRGAFVLPLVLLAWPMLCSASSWPWPCGLSHRVRRTLSASSPLLLSCTFVIPDAFQSQGNWEWRNPQCPCNAAFILSITKLCNTDATWCWHRPKCPPPVARQASLEDGVFGSAAWSCFFFFWGGVFHSDPSIIFKEQLLTFGDFKPTFLFSLILAVSLYSFFLFAFMSNCFRCTLNKIREFLLISQYWGTLWSHQLWAVCHNMTLFMQERVLTKLASDVPRLNLSRKVVQVCDWLLNWYSGSHVYWWLIYFYF